MYNIAISGVGGGVGQGIIKSLTGFGYNLIALDGEVLAAGLYSANSAYVIPYAGNPNFINALLNICKKEKIDLLFPGLDAELMPLSRHIEDFKAIGTTVVVSSSEVVKISDDKQETYDELSKAGINIPYTTSLDEFDFRTNSFPVIIKQKVGGARSKNIFIIKNEKEWLSVLDDITDRNNFIVMDYIEGHEYTCGTVNLGGHCKGVIVMRRILRDGDTHKCFSEINPVVEETVRRVVEAIKPFGACNVQLRVRDGVPYVFEINARCSGTTASRTLCGFNEPKMIADYLLNNVEPEYQIIEKTILRYWNELEIENDVISLLEANNEIHRDNYSPL